MAKSENLKKIEDFLKDQERLEEAQPEEINHNTEKNDDAISQLQKFLEDQSHFDEKKESFLSKLIQ